MDCGRNGVGEYFKEGYKTPTGAIRRASVGDVVEIIDNLCIGCKACANNCPYDAIVMNVSPAAPLRVTLRLLPSKVNPDGVTTTFTSTLSAGIVLTF
jgi:Fe-S-cluster-containing dehydrogenase component